MLLGMRLALSGGRRAAATLALTLASVAAGTCLLLLALTVAPALQARADRTAWTEAGFGASADAVVQIGSATPHTVVASNSDTYRDRQVEVIDLAGSGPGAPVPPGIASLPEAGQAFVSPALAALLARSPQLAGRYGKVVGQIGEEALPGPDSLLVARGATTTGVNASGIAVRSFPDRGEVIELTGVVRLLLLLGAVAMLAPLALLVAVATRLSAATRERRLAALRLVGATDRQVTRLAAGESLLAGAGGAVAGTALFFAIRPLAAYVTYDGGRWRTSDLNPGVLLIVVVLVAVPLVAAVATQLSLSRVKHSPLGVSRRAPGKALRAWRLLPLLVALPALAMALSSDAAAAGGRGRLVVGAFAVLLASLLYAGPWLTRATGLALARAGGPSTLLAGRRLADDPRGGFRAIAGAVLAVLILTMFTATTPAAAESLADTRITGQQAGTAQVSVHSASPGVSARLLADIRAVPGVPAATAVRVGQVQDGSDPANVWIGACEEIVAAARLAAVPCGQAPAVVADDRRHLTRGGAVELDNLTPRRVLTLGESLGPQDVSAATVPVPATAVMPEQKGIDTPDLLLESTESEVADALRPTMILVRYTDDEALEQVRTLVLSRVSGGQVSTRDSSYNGYNSDVRRLYRILTIGTLGTFGVAALGLLVAVATGLLERRTPFALMRAAGTPLRTLRLTAFLEAAAPLAVLSVLAAALGATVGHWAVASTGQSQQVPWVGLLVPLAAGLTTAFLVLSASTILVRQITDTEQTRFD